MLIIAAGANPSEPVAALSVAVRKQLGRGQARWFQAASPATVHAWVVPHAGHTQGLATAPQAWETHVSAS